MNDNHCITWAKFNTIRRLNSQPIIIKALKPTELLEWLEWQKWIKELNYTIAPTRLQISIPTYNKRNKQGISGLYKQLIRSFHLGTLPHHSWRASDGVDSLTWTPIYPLKKSFEKTSMKPLLYIAAYTFCHRAWSAARWWPLLARHVEGTSEATGSSNCEKNQEKKKKKLKMVSTV